MSDQQIEWKKETITRDDGFGRKSEVEGWVLYPERRVAIYTKSPPGATAAIILIECGRALWTFRKSKLLITPMVEDAMKQIGEKLSDLAVKPYDLFSEEERAPFKALRCEADLKIYEAMCASHDQILEQMSDGGKYRLVCVELERTSHSCAYLRVAEGVSRQQLLDAAKDQAEGFFDEIETQIVGEWKPTINDVKFYDFDTVGEVSDD